MLKHAREGETVVAPSPRVAEANRIDHNESLIDRAPWTLRADLPLGAVVAELLERQRLSVPIVRADGSFVGMCTVSSIASRCMSVPGEVMALMPTLAFLGDDIGRMRERLRPSLDQPAAAFFDPAVPTLEEPISLAGALLALYRGHPAIPVIDRSTGRLAGTIDWTRIIGAAHARS